MRVAALMIVRDEADVLAINLAHHRALGIDDFWIIDNGSTDATPEILRKAAAANASIRWQRDDGPFAQPEMTTALARDAHRAGADWIVAIDADEFWVTDDRSLHEILARPIPAWPLWKPMSSTTCRGAGSPPPARARCSP